MHSFDDLQARWDAAPNPPAGAGTVAFIVLRKGGGVHETPGEAAITVEDGVVGDRWTIRDDPERNYQITLMNRTIADLIAHGDCPGYDAGDNFLVDLDLSEAALPVGAQIRVGTAVLEVTPDPHMGCKDFAARFGQDALRWINWKDNRAERRRGVNCRVVEPGVAKIGDAVVFVD